MKNPEARSHPTRTARAFLAGLTLAILVAVPLLAAPGGATFHNIAGDPGSPFTYHRALSPDLEAHLDAVKALPVVNFPEVVQTPIKSRGAPGVAIFDFDGDGDLDVFVTNGPGRPHSLYANQLRETGHFGFVDVAETAGVGAAAQDGTGVCYGDIDNDGDPDLVVLGRNSDNRLFENRGDGTFVDITAASGLPQTSWTPSSCGFGDTDGDGLLDLFIANTFDWSTKTAILVEPFDLNEPNEFYRNVGHDHFVPALAESGLEPPFPEITWAVSFVDYDLDGDVDLFTASDQAGIPFASQGGVDRGVIRVYENDGLGHFTEISDRLETSLRPGGWMGFAFGDFNCDGRFDFFGSNEGDWLFRQLGAPYHRGERSSRWFLGDGQRFLDPGVGDLLATPFAWGTAAIDFDNDGDQDLVIVGGLDAGAFIDASNPGAILVNDGCSARFTFDRDALGGHLRRDVQGLAKGDLDGDGRIDFVAAASSDFPEPIPLIPFNTDNGSPFDPVARAVPTFVPRPDGAGLVASGISLLDGTLVVEMNRGETHNRAFEIGLLGTVGLVPGGRANRDGIGAVLAVTPRRGSTVLEPLVGGSSYASQNSPILHFGLGRASTGTVEVLWPGGTRNRLYGVHAGERLLFPEIPCSFSADWPGPAPYLSCVAKALDRLVDAGILSHGEAGRFGASAIRAFVETRGSHGH